MQHIGPSHTLSAPSPGTDLTVCPMKTLKDVAGEKDMCILLILALGPGQVTQHQAEKMSSLLAEL